MITEIRFIPRDAAGMSPRPTLLEWLVPEDGRAAAGETLCRYEVDKAVLPFLSPVTGILRRHIVPEGARFAPGDALALASDRADEVIPEVHQAELPREEDIGLFDWSEIDNRSGAAEPLGVMRRAIADRMAMSKRHIPCFYLTASVDMTGCIELRKTLKRSGHKATFNDMVIKASALALARHPRAAAVYTPQGLVPRTSLNIGFAAALPDDGLVVPVVKNAEQKSLAAIAAETRELAATAKRGDLAPADCSGGVFSVSYLGAYRVDNFIAIVNPGEAAILAVGATVETPVVAYGEVTVRPLAKMTLSCDHRSIDGILAARLMDEIVKILEEPEPALGTCAP